MKRYVAYGTTGNKESDEALKQLFEEQKVKTPKDDFIQLIKRKSPLAQKMHGSRRIGPSKCLLNDMFSADNPEKLIYELENSKWIVKGDPGKSPLLNHAVSFQGPMYQVRLTFSLLFTYLIEFNEYRYLIMMN